jgi:hypothetical protein
MAKLTSKVLESVYTKLDDTILKHASKHGMFLIGGTAIDVCCKKLGIRNWRQRSKNDFDFVCGHDSEELIKFINKLISIGFEINVSDDYMVILEHPKHDISVDVLIDYGFREEDEYKIGDTLVANPIYLFTSKFSRYITKSPNPERDFNDLVQILQIIDGFNLFDEFESEIYKSSYGESELEEINKMIEYALQIQASDDK